MIAGHYAAALVPYELTRKTQKTALWIFLLASQFLDFLMLAFVSFGIEKLEPADFFDVAFVSMHSDMFVSHDILPVLGWAMLFGICVWAVTKKYIVALWCAGLVLIHEIFDLVVGFEHYILGNTTMPLGLNLYNNAPVAGLIIEAVICAAIVFWFCRRRAQRNEPVSPALKWGLYGFLVGATLTTLPIATQSLNSLFGI